MVTVSQHAKKEIEHFFPGSRGKVYTIYNGVDHSLYYPRSRKEQEEIIAKYGLSRKKFFVFFSNIEPRKNIEKLLDAFKMFVDKTGEREVPLLIVGGMGWGNEKIFAKIKKMKEEDYRILKPDHYVPDADMPALLSASICLVHPALYEGFGLTPLEAMSCGTYVIVGDNSSLPEVMGEQFRRYVDVTNASSIAKEMMYYYSRQDENKYGLLRSKQFAWSRSAAELIRVIEEVDEK